MVYRNNIIRAAIIGTIIVVGIIFCILFLVEDQNTKQTSASSLLLEDNDISSNISYYTKQQVYTSDSNDFDLLSIEQPSDTAAAVEDTNNNEVDTIVNVSFDGQRSILQEIVDDFDYLDPDFNGMFISVLVDTEDLNELEQRYGDRVSVDEQATAELRASIAKVQSPDISISEGPYAKISGFPCYRTVEGTYATGQDIADAYPDIAEWKSIGKSFQGRDINVLKLTKKNNDITNKPVLFMSCAVHAREYTPAEFCTRFAEMLVEKYDYDADITTLLDHNEIHIIPITNPDGRIEAQKGVLWRKNNNNNHCGSGQQWTGVDLNRNFPYEWGAPGSSNTKCKQTYRGPSPESEPETKAVLNYLDTILPPNQRVLGNGGINSRFSDPDTTTGMALDIHSYSELILYPWGFEGKCGNHDQFVTLSRKLAYFNRYKAQKSTELYVTRGTTVDTYYGLWGVPSMTYELGTSFFQDCSSFENKILPDNLNSLLYAAKATRTPFKTPYGPDALNLSLRIEDNRESATVVATIVDNRYYAYDGAEPSQRIASASLYVDTPPWDGNASPLSMAPIDGSYNSVAEDVRVTFSTSSLTPGRHTLYVVGEDALEHKGAFSAIFLYVGRCVNAVENSGTNCFSDDDCTCSRRHLVEHNSLRGLGTEIVDIAAESCECAIDPRAPSYDNREIVCGSTQGSCRGDPVREANPDEKHAVRCCSDTPLAGFIRKFNTCPSNVWGESEIDGVCHGSKTFDQAREICSSINARLCTKEELLKDCTRNSGCGFDSFYNWSMEKKAPTLCAVNEFVSNKVCVSCPAGTTNVAGDDPSGGNTSCDPTLCAVNEYVSSNQCVACPAGTTNAAGDNASGGNTSCDATICAVNEFVQNNACKTCPVGTINEAGDDASGSNTSCTQQPIEQTPTQPSPTASRYYAVCGSSNGSCKNNRVIETGVNELHEVRCCAPSNPGGWQEKRPGCSVWGESDRFPVNGVNCHARKTFTQAVAICSSAGGRLCTRDELFNDCTRGTGCMYDNEHIWSETPVPENSLSPQPPASQYYIVCGGSNGSCSDERVREANSDTPQAVRCCSNTPLPGFIRKYPNTCPSNVWGDSEVNGQCHGSKTFGQARDLCSSIGARLCTKDEIVKDCTRNSGCGYDSRYAWSDTPVPESSSRSYYTICGRSTSARCSGGPQLTDANELKAVRCCSDSNLGSGWLKRSSTCPWAESEINGSCKKGRTFAQAQTSCNSIPGARLCTLSELERDCTAGTGCQFDHERVWSSTESPPF